MGTPVQPNPTGANCAHWDPPAETPLYIWAIFWDIQKGDQFGAFEPPNGHAFRLTQTDGQPCRWKYECGGYGWQVEVGIDPDATWIDMVDCVHPNAHYFGQALYISPPPEYCTFANVYRVPWGNWGYLGWAMIWWGDLVAWLSAEMGLDSSDDLMLETLPIDIASMVIKLCSKRMNTNVSFKFSG